MGQLFLNPWYTYLVIIHSRSSELLDKYNCISDCTHRTDRARIIPLIFIDRSSHPYTIFYPCIFVTNHSYIHIFFPYTFLHCGPYPHVSLLRVCHNLSIWSRTCPASAICILIIACPWSVQLIPYLTDCSSIICKTYLYSTDRPEEVAFREEKFNFVFTGRNYTLRIIVTCFRLWWT